MFTTLTSTLHTCSTRIASRPISQLVNSLYNGPVRRLTRRGTKAGRRFIRNIQTVIGSHENFYHRAQNGVDFCNIVTIPCNDQFPAFDNTIPTRITHLPQEHRYHVCTSKPNNLTIVPTIQHERKINPLKLYTLNCRSVKNKALSISDLIISNNIDLIALTETWLGTDIDKVVLGDLVPEGYDIHQIPRKQRGGGVALIYNSSICVKSLTSELNFTQFEHLECVISSQNSNLRVCIVYRPPPSKSNKLKVSAFFDEWSQYLSHHAISPEELIITGDMNFHLDIQHDQNSQQFLQSLHEHGLKQLVNKPTHVREHILDVVVTRDNSRILQSMPTVDDHFICDSRGVSSGDHKGITSLIHLSKPPKQRKTVTFRKFRKIDICEFELDIAASLTTSSDGPCLDDLVDLYYEGVLSTVQKHAPMQTKTITLRPNTQWYSEELHTAKREKRKAERVWRRTNLEIHRQIYREKCLLSSRLLFQSKQDYYSTSIMECGNDTKRLFKLTNKLLGDNNEVILPTSDNDRDLSNEFGKYFLGKIQTIRETLQSQNDKTGNYSDVLWADVQYTGDPLIEFSPTSSDEIRKLIMNSPSKSCDLDPIPTYLLKQCIESFIPIVTSLVNKSLCDSSVPTIFKQATVRPLLKKPGLDKENLKNYRPVSNLPFVSKIVEKVVSARIENHLNANNLMDSKQSAYRSCHSTETALLKVHHDVVTALDKNCCCILVMLDLSSAFDVIDHQILFQRLKHSYGITGSALAWIKSYLCDRRQCVAVGSELSESQEIKIGVPQGSVLGPRLYCLFSKPIGRICDLHDMDYHCYADDSQIYIVVEPRDNWDDISARLMACLSDIRKWMSSNLLKLNQDKTELMVFVPKRNKSENHDYNISFGGNIIYDAEFVKNLGMYLDKSLIMEKQCTSVSRSCYMHIRRIGSIRPFISEDACKILVNSLVTSRLDYGNALLYGVNKQYTNKLQRVQNTAARLITRTKKYEHITPVLIQLHWLPVEYRIQYKILLYVFKCLHELAPGYLSELVTPYTPARSLRSETACLVTVPSTRTKTYGERRFDKAAATLWNSLPSQLRNGHKLECFKKDLKTHLFRKAFNV